MPLEDPTNIHLPQKTFHRPLLFPPVMDYETLGQGSRILRPPAPAPSRFEELPPTPIHTLQKPIRMTMNPQMTGTTTNPVQALSSLTSNEDLKLAQATEKLHSESASIQQTPI